MAVMAGDLVTRLGIDGRKFQSGLNKARGETRSFASDVTSIVSGIALYDIGKRGAMGLKDMLVSTVRLAAEAEVMGAEFGVLLGDVDKSVGFFDQLEKFAARTSFSLQSAGDSARQLMAAGVQQNNLIDTMQLLGDLSMGDANKLGFLSKAYTDVFNKGRLQGQEIKQFAENGVGIVKALSLTMGKTTSEILKMSEAGLISFSDMQIALKSLTAEGGRFFGAMEGRNKTMIGQYDALVEGIQKTGRAIGAEMLPAIKSVVTEANAMLSKFNELPSRMEFIGNVTEAAFDVAFLNIRQNWDSLLADMTKGTLTLMRDFGFEMVNGPAMQAIEVMAGMAVKGGNGGGPNNLADAQARLDQLLKQVLPEKPFVGPKQQLPFVGPLQAQQDLVGGQKLRTLFSGIFEQLAPVAEAAQMDAQGIIDRLKIRGNAALGTLENLFSGDNQTAKKAAPQLAGAMEAGSKDAYSTIVQAMVRTADPTVNAIKNQTRELVKKLKPKEPQVMIAMGAVNP